MACHELAALRIGMMKVIGIDDPAELQHELAEIGDAAHKPGPIATLTKAQNWAELRQSYERSLVDLETKVAGMPASDPALGYYRTLLVITKKVELELAQHELSLKALYRDLEEVHDYIHEIYPSS